MLSVKGSLRSSARAFCVLVLKHGQRGILQKIASRALMCMWSLGIMNPRTFSALSGFGIRASFFAHGQAWVDVGQI